MTTEQENELLRSALEYERQMRYAAEMAATDTHDVRRSERPELFTTDIVENERWQR